ncbi:hypothetical protein PGQ11_003003 [Apiospora arundinis]|uniref:Epidermal growth factor-like domain-containing protein n=1 Tax=Apiospora arundinis TaxID=335852 RepID=A0ABR2J499_9PEZI
MAAFANYRVIVFLALVSAAYACKTDDECSLNGICTPCGTCDCDPGWTSPDCGKLDLQPATRWTGYNHTNITLPDHYSTKGGNSSWGGQIVRDRHDKSLFHLVASQFARGCGLAGWRPFSTVIRAESRTGPAGPYRYAQELFGTFHHNPTVVWSPADQKYLLYSIGIDTVTPTRCASYKWSNNISVSSAPDVRGPWTPPRLVVNGTNPAPWPVWGEEESSGPQIALAVEDNKIFMADDGWNDGVYKLAKTMPWNTSDYSDHWTEDPFLWRDKRGNWHILCHWMIDIAVHGVKYPRVGGHLFSRNLTGDWTFKLQEVYNTTVHFIDGGRTDYYRRERPKLFFSDDGLLRPLYLINGVQEFNSSASYTLIQPIRDDTGTDI